jgi:hypothetical protein
LKNSIKDIQDTNQGAGQSFFIKLHVPLKIVCNLLDSQKAKEFSECSSAVSSQNGTIISQKMIVDVLVMFWENYFCKHMVKIFLANCT